MSICNIDVTAFYYSTYDYLYIRYLQQNNIFCLSVFLANLGKEEINKAIFISAKVRNPREQSHWHPLVFSIPR